MPYVKPTDFSASTKLISSTWTDDSDDLRIYLHEGIATGDIASGDWADTRHLAGPPVIDPVSMIQHGVTGHQGGISTSASLTRLTFATQALNGASNGQWGLTLRIEVRRRSDIIMSYWAETIAGPDDRSAGRTTWIGHWVGSPAFTSGPHTMPARANAFGFDNNSPYKVQPDLPWEFSGWNDFEGQVVVSRYADNVVAPVTVGLAAWGQVGRIAVLNWGVQIESYT